MAFVIGCRGKRTCRRLWEAIPTQYKAPHCFADVWEAYTKVIEAEQLTQINPKPILTIKPTPIIWRDSTEHCDKCDKDAGDWCEKRLPFPNATTCTRPLSLFIHNYNKSKVAT